MEHYLMTGTLTQILPDRAFRVAFDLPGEESMSLCPMSITLTRRGYFDPELREGDPIRVFCRKQEGIAVPEYVLIASIDFPDIFDDEQATLSDFLLRTKAEQALIVRRNKAGWTACAEAETAHDRLRFRMAPQARAFYALTRHTYTEAQEAAIHEWLDNFGDDREKLETLMRIVPDRPSAPIDPAAVRARLDKELWGMDKVKHRLLAHLTAVQDAAEKGAVFCLVGPPGVGKTAIARALGGALGKPFIYQSCAGWTSSIDPLGCSSTFNHASVGRLAAAFARAGTTDAVFVLDELDKAPGPERMGKDGNAHFSLLEVFSERQVTDLFLGVPIETKNTLWIITCNSLRNLPEVLVDRFDQIIEVPAYSDEELTGIVKACILPRMNEKYHARLALTEEALAAVVRAAHDAGARGTTQNVEKIFKEIIGAQGIRETVIDTAQVCTILGVQAEKPGKGHSFVTHLPGAAVALGVSNLGKGRAIPVETRILPGSGLVVTGLPDSNPEVLDTIRTAMTALELDYGFDFSDKKLHVHFCHGSSKKGGSSAGLSIFLSLYSAMTGDPLPVSAAATGEIDLYNHVFAVGGLMEKIEAARKAGLRKVYVPMDSLQSLSETEQADLRANPTIRVIGVRTTFDLIHDLYGKLAI